MTTLTLVPGWLVFRRSDPAPVEPAATPRPASDLVRDLLDRSPDAFHCEEDLRCLMGLFPRDF